MLKLISILFFGGLFFANAELMALMPTDTIPQGFHYQGILRDMGGDEVKNLDPETLYFIVNLLNKAKIKKIRNEILNLTLPLRV